MNRAEYALARLAAKNIGLNLVRRPSVVFLDSIDSRYSKKFRQQFNVAREYPDDWFLGCTAKPSVSRNTLDTEVPTVIVGFKQIAYFSLRKFVSYARVDTDGGAPE